MTAVALDWLVHKDVDEARVGVLEREGLGAGQLRVRERELKGEEWPLQTGAEQKVPTIEISADLGDEIIESPTWLASRASRLRVRIAMGRPTFRGSAIIPE